MLRFHVLTATSLKSTTTTHYPSGDDVLEMVQRIPTTNIRKTADRLWHFSNNGVQSRA